MRIVGGAFSGRRFSPPASIPARPTTDVAKEGLFNTLENMRHIEGMETCDLFGGTGSISYELASRGAAALTLVERDTTSVGFIKKTATELGIASRMNILRGDVFRFLKSVTGQYDFVFAGPPYALQEIDELPVLVFDRNMLKPNGIFVLEHTPRNNYQQFPCFLRIKNYGTTVFTFFEQPTAM